MSDPVADEVVEGSIESGACITACIADDGELTLREHERLRDGAWWVVNDYKELTLSAAGARTLAHVLLARYVKVAWPDAQPEYASHEPDCRCGDCKVHA